MRVHKRLAHLNEENLGFNVHRLSDPSCYKEILLTEFLFASRGVPFDRIRGIFHHSSLFRELDEEQKTLVIKGFVSAIQWLGTPVGSQWLVEAIEEIGGRLELNALESLLTESCADTRTKAVEVWKTLQEFKKEEEERATKREKVSLISK